MANEHALTAEEERKAIDSIFAKVRTSAPGKAGAAAEAISVGPDSGICKYKDVITTILTEALSLVPGLPSIAEALIIRLVTGVLDKICSKAAAI
jgi:hypothetical protein